MYHSIQKIALVIGLTLSVGLVSCQKDSAITPDQPQLDNSSSKKAADDIIVVNMAKKYTLIKQGNAVLTYYPDGRLQKVTQGADFHRDYTYSGNTIQAISYRYGKMAFKDTYLIDPATNRCYESEQIDYKVLQTPFNSNLNDPFRTRTWVYAYNAKGQLISCGEKYKAGTRTEYSYNAQGNLDLVTTYWEPMSKVNPWYTISLKYLENNARQNQNPGKINVIEYVEDKYPTNFNWILQPTPYSYIDYYAQAIPERYLKIYGKMSKNLLASANWHVEGMGYHGSNFTYSLNADGYVTERKRFDDQYPQLLETEAYDYNVSYLGVSL
ncbi:hypothetical protein GCM10028803_31730 [Larkinella knui]|uniref:DUF4595 domain-containing protein n=1 Tax=Larkinella knui TaxID=2025310 RepID=A0A3P1CXZ6_9BACT|nr:DUF4595 domain-containing protein [Larkinella knui]RRB18195.1 hypothetical protein EHT87_07945 [Larkinella knui]